MLAARCLRGEEVMIMDDQEQAVDTADEVAAEPAAEESDEAEATDSADEADEDDD